MPLLSLSPSRINVLRASPIAVMASTVVATSQASRQISSLRQRRESARPGLSKISTRNSTTDALETPHTSDSPPPLVQDEQYVLRKFKGSKPSCAIHLYPSYFRLHGSADNWSYDSPMASLLDHIRHREVPHDFLEELYASKVPWYDSCLIVTIYNHRHVTPTLSSTGTNHVGGNSLTPYSVHNFNEHITPSPFIGNKEKISLLSNHLKDSGAKERSKTSNAQSQMDKENIQAPNGNTFTVSKSSLSPSKEPTVTTVVLFPTQLSFQRDMEILAKTPLKDYLVSKRNNMHANALMPNTPLSATNSAFAKTQMSSSFSSSSSRMCLDSSNIKEFESAVVLAQNPVLYLEPAANFDEMIAIHDALRDPLHNCTPTKPKARKRTIAEVEADEQQAEKELQFILAFEVSNSASTAASSVNVAEGAIPIVPTYDFKRLKVLESIKNEARRKEQAVKDRIHEEKEQRERDAKAAHEQIQLAQMQQAEETAKKRELAMRMRQQQLQHDEHQQQLHDQYQRQVLLAQQQQQQNQNAIAAQQHRERQQQLQQQQHGAQQQANNHLIGTSSVPNSHVTALSSGTGHMQLPNFSQQTPMTSSSPALDVPMPPNTIPMAISMSSTPMMHTNSNPHGRSPPTRPQSASIQSHANVSTISRQASQQMPNTTVGTPVVQHTPSMTSVGLTRHMTPQSRLVGSPISSEPLQATPMMMTPSQPQHTPLTPEYMTLYRRQQHFRANQALAAAGVQNPQALQNMQNLQNMGNMPPHQQAAMMQKICQQNQQQQQQQQFQQAQQRQMQSGVPPQHLQRMMMYLTTFKHDTLPIRQEISTMISEYAKAYPPLGEWLNGQHAIFERHHMNFAAQVEQRAKAFLQQGNVTQEILQHHLLTQMRDYRTAMTALKERIMGEFNGYINSSNGGDGMAQAMVQQRQQQLQRQQQQQLIQVQQVRQQSGQPQQTGMINQATQGSQNSGSQMSPSSSSGIMLNANSPAFMGQNNGTSLMHNMSQGQSQQMLNEMTTTQRQAHSLQQRMIAIAAQQQRAGLPPLPAAALQAQAQTSLQQQQRMVAMQRQSSMMGTNMNGMTGMNTMGSIANLGNMVNGGNVRVAMGGNAGGMMNNNNMHNIGMAMNNMGHINGVSANNVSGMNGMAGLNNVNGINGLNVNAMNGMPTANGGLTMQQMQAMGLNNMNMNLNMNMNMNNMPTMQASQASQPQGGQVSHNMNPNPGK